MAKYVDENKETFIASMHTLLSESTREYADISAMHYIVDENDDEWLYVNYGRPQKRVNITADSCSSILRDFINRIESEPWLIDDRYIEFPEET